MTKDNLQALLGRVERRCAHCGGPLKLWRGNVTRARMAARQFCSQACNGASRAGRPPETAGDALRRRTMLDPVSGCHVWTGGVNKHRYGVLSFAGRKAFAHRLAYQTWVGEIPEGFQVCHHCDNRRCLNPAHLFLGSNAENVADRNAKGRQARGERQGRAKLSDDDVRAIRASAARIVDLAAQYGVAETTISNIRHGKRWTHVA